MTYAIHNWRDISKYPSGPFAAAPPAFIERRKKHNYSDEQISTIFWHWELLRRHPLYQKHWASEGVEYFLMFGVCGTFRPDPKTDCPADLLLRYELFNKDFRYQTLVEPHKSLEENVTRIKRELDSFKESKSDFELFMGSGYVPWPKLKTRKCHFPGNFRTFLRVLDAIHAGETVTQIARELQPKFEESSLFNSGTRLKRYAYELQAALTGLPSMDKPDT